MILCFHIFSDSLGCRFAHFQHLHLKCLHFITNNFFLLYKFIDIVSSAMFIVWCVIIVHLLQTLVIVMVFKIIGALYFFWHFTTCTYFEVFLCYYFSFLYVLYFITFLFIYGFSDNFWDYNSEP